MHQKNRQACPAFPSSPKGLVIAPGFETLDVRKTNATMAALIYWGGITMPEAKP